MRILFLLAVVASFAVAADEPAKIEVKSYGPYFESNKSGLKGDASYLVFTDKTKFDSALRLRPPLIGGKRPVPVPDASFLKSHVLVVIRRGKTIFDYSDLKAEAKGDTLRFSFRSAARGAAGSATFKTPLVVTVTKGKYKQVEFVENGKKAETVKLD
jgi:hypothetical protein